MTPSSDGHAAGAIVFVGPMGAGKSSLGKRVARALGLPFTDTDTAIVRAHGPIAELFAREGEARFREIEREAVRTALEGGGVVALGGGAVLSAETRERLRAHRVVLLTVDETAIAHRIRGHKRPLLNGDVDPVAEWTRIRAEREPLYAEVADAVFDTSRGPTQRTVERIVAWLRGDEPADDETTARAARTEEES
ncbi:shikimate kinase [Microbacterium sp. JZ70]|uniref:shikimate kinase n=1 Tax=Microbacterium sp. JZ37 TaxID=2654193 RepID=UPI002B48EF96|nr:shikimate kinase [Microbacterium sp. JZ37]WRH17539.1 AAA family ATPase [Microbacterium sp. JZ37]